MAIPPEADTREVPDLCTYEQRSVLGQSQEPVQHTMQLIMLLCHQG